MKLDPMPSLNGSKLDHQQQLWRGKSVIFIGLFQCEKQLLLDDVKQGFPSGQRG